jgi:ribonuclease BN (tRNA processing enzyme)
MLLVRSASVMAQPCATGVAVQVLGSGGPAINATRASTSYLLWVDGKARILVDAGGGAFLRFGQSTAQLPDLQLLAISHLHPDHVSDLTALIWTSRAIRRDPLPVSGPSGQNGIPDIATFLNRLFDPERGAFPIMGTAVGGAQRGNGVGSVRLEPITVDVAGPGPKVVLNLPGLIVTATAIPHDDMPTLAYRVQVGNRVILFSSDQTGTSATFPASAKNADLLIMHMQVAADAPPSPRHASPAVVGQVAAATGAHHLVLSHIGPIDIPPAVAQVKQSFKGSVTVAEDLVCIAVP